MKPETVTDVILIILLVLLAIVYIFNTNPVNVFAADSDPADTEPTDISEVLERIESNQVTEQLSNDETKTIITGLASSVNGIYEASQEQTNVISWLIALTAFQSALTLVLIFAAGWGR